MYNRIISFESHHLIKDREATWKSQNVFQPLLVTSHLDAKQNTSQNKNVINLIGDSSSDENLFEKMAKVG